MKYFQMKNCERTNFRVGFSTFTHVFILTVVAIVTENLQVENISATQVWRYIFARTKI